MTALQEFSEEVQVNKKKHFFSCNISVCFQVSLVMNNKKGLLKNLL